MTEAEEYRSIRQRSGSGRECLGPEPHLLGSRPQSLGAERKILGSVGKRSCLGRKSFNTEPAVCNWLAECCDTRKDSCDSRGIIREDGFRI